MSSLNNESDDESSVYSGLENEKEEENDESELSDQDDASEPSSYESGKESEIDGDEDEEKEIQYDYVDTSDEEDLRNTIGNIPVEWYNDSEHIGYDWSAKRIGKPKRKAEIDEFLSKMDDPDYWRTVRDKQTGQDVKLTDNDVAAIKNIEAGRHPSVGYNPYQPYVDYFSGIVMQHPLSDRPEHKRSFIPSKSEKQQISRLVHAIKMGWLKPRKPKSEADEAPKYYDLWAINKEGETKNELARMKMHIPAPKMRLPGHEESYNPPPEYLLTPEEEEKWQQQESYKRKHDFVPQKYGSLRHVPAYPEFIRDRFERCMDLYLAPRQRKMKLNVDPKDLLPKLPNPKDLQPFPTTLSLVYRGHTDLVRTVCIEPNGQFIASGGDDQTVRIWEINTGRCVKQFSVEGTVQALAWCPNSKMTLLAAAVDTKLYLLNAGVGDKLLIADTDAVLTALRTSNADAFGDGDGKIVSWSVCKDEKFDEGFRLCISHRKALKQVTWYAKGDYFATVAPEDENRPVVIHQLSKLKSQAPFSKRIGLVQEVLFHPSRPYFYVATQRHIRVYNLIKQELMKKLIANCKWISSMALHPKGDNIIVGSYDSRLNWFDLDLSAKPYKTLRLHKSAIRSVTFHRHYPLFASASDDGSVIVCHGMVYSDLLQNPLIVPVKILRGHGVKDNLSVLDCCFHSTQPWIFTCGADGTVRLYT